MDPVDTPAPSRAPVSVATHGLTRTFGPVTALSSLSVEMPDGVVGLVGANGAGKSTLIKVLLGLLAPSAGRAEVLGMDPVTQGLAIRQAVGYMPESDCLPPDVSATEFVVHMARMSGLPSDVARERTADTLRHVGLYEERYRSIGGYSTGMKQRVKLAQALVHDPQLVFLDEPTNGLDPDGRRRMLDLVLRVHAELGTGVILASHLLGDVERVADQLVILDQGLIKAAGSMAGLRRALARRVELRFLDPLDAAQEAALADLGAVLEARNGLYDLELAEADPVAAFRWAQGQGATLIQLTPRHDRLDEVLLRALHGELEQRGLRIRPHAWISNEWFSPDTTPGIAIPFYLAHPRLARLCIRRGRSSCNRDSARTTLSTPPHRRKRSSPQR